MPACPRPAGHSAGGWNTGPQGRLCRARASSPGGRELVSIASPVLGCRVLCDGLVSAQTSAAIVAPRSSRRRPVVTRRRIDLFHSGRGFPVRREPHVGTPKQTVTTRPARNRSAPGTASRDRATLPTPPPHRDDQSPKFVRPTTPRAGGAIPDAHSPGCAASLVSTALGLRWGLLRP